MLTTRLILTICSVGIVILDAGVVFGQDFPNKPIRIVTAAAGSGSDVTSRLIAQGISSSLGQQVVIENRGGGFIQGEVVSRAPPDGYTLLLTSNSFWTGPLLQRVPYDPIKDFLPISLASRAPNLLVVHPSLPVNTVKELIALAKARPGELNYSSGSTGGSGHLAAALFAYMAGVNIVRVPYKNPGLALNDLLSGQVQMTFEIPNVVVPHIKSGKLKALAVASVKPSTLFIDLPTVAASGLSGYESASIFALFALAKTSQTIINRLSQEVVRFLKTTEGREQFLNIGIETVGSSPEELAAKMKSDMASLGKMIKDVGIRAD